MARESWSPIYVHGMSLEGSYLSEATHAQLELFYSLPPDVQAKVYLNEFSDEEVRDSRNHRCNSPYRSCVLNSACTASSASMAPSRSTRTAASTECARSASVGASVAWQGANSDLRVMPA